MKTYTENDIVSLLDRAGYNRDVVMIHSSLYNLGLLENCQPEDLPDKILNTLMTHTNDGALLLPTFNYTFPKTRTCDLRDQPSEVGILTEEFRSKTPLRSGHPIFSFSGTGEKAELILKPDTAEFNPFGENSVFSRLHDSDAIMLMLGVSIVSACTYLIYCESRNQVPYRFYKPFYGNVTLMNGSTCEDNFYHFCFPQDGSIQQDYVPVENRLLKDGILNRVPFGMGQAYWFRARPFFDRVRDYLQADPWFLLPEKPKAFWGYVDGAEKIVDSELS
ncbi:MAG: AAC(3) family N-acetyltransferase [FCB group bacterium]|nr:AAC(3) family N-acetyltransferase [FCB group bacterium]